MNINSKDPKMVRQQLVLEVTTDMIEKMRKKSQKCPKLKFSRGQISCPRVTLRLPKKLDVRRTPLSKSAAMLAAHVIFSPPFINLFMLDEVSPS